MEVVVDAEVQAIGYYQRFGFELLDVVAGQMDERPRPRSMFLAIGKLERAATWPAGRSTPSRTICMTRRE